MQCNICMNSQNNKIYYVKERMLNRGDEFKYLYCKKCGTLQLIDIPKDMEIYYKNYPVFNKEVNSSNKYLKYIFGNISASRIRGLLPRTIRESMNYKGYMCIAKLNIHKRGRILDVGCGTGEWLNSLHDIGYKNLYGVDKYAPRKNYIRGVKFVRGDVFKITKSKFDLITLHHSFEHMDNPGEVLKYLNILIKKKGTIVIRIPVMESEAWQKYKENWYQIDAPRHFFLYTERALRMLCDQTGLEIFDIQYDSNFSQYYVSEKYMKTNDSFSDISRRPINESTKRMYNKWSDVANKEHKGDQAIFYIRKKRGNII